LPSSFLHYPDWLLLQKDFLTAEVVLLVQLLAAQKEYWV
jgi:hypothetical protein